MTTSASDENRLRQASAALALEGVAVRVATTMGRAGLRAILLKGPALEEWLYPHGARRYSDVDLLIPRRERDAAEAVLEGLGFQHVAIDVLPHDRPHHARTWLAPGGAAVDLHHSLVGVGASSEAVWDVLAAQTDRLDLGDSQIEIPSVPGRAIVVALHAAQHGVGGEGPLEDLRRVLDRLSLGEWRAVRQLAEQLEAMPALAAGLRLLPRGREIATELELPETTSVETLLRSTSAPTMSLGFDWLSRTHGFRARARFVARKVAPQPAFMRAWTPLARRGRSGLAAAYLWRVVWLGFRSGPAYVAWRKAARASRGGSKSDVGQRWRG